jgi:hypothetical protein
VRQIGKTESGAQRLPDPEFSTSRKVSSETSKSFAAAGSEVAKSSLLTEDHIQMSVVVCGEDERVDLLLKYLVHYAALCNG